MYAENLHKHHGAISLPELERHEASKAEQPQTHGQLEAAKQDEIRLRRQFLRQQQQYQAQFSATQTSQVGKVVQEAAMDAEIPSQQTEVQRQDDNAPVPGTDFQEQFDSTARTNSYLDDFDYETFLFPDTPVNDDTDPLQTSDEDIPNEWPYVNSQTQNEWPYSNLQSPTPRGFYQQVRTGQRSAMFTPEEIQYLPHLTDNERRQYEAGFQSLWTRAIDSPQNSPNNIAARQKIIDFTKMLITKIQARRTVVEQQQKKLAIDLGLKSDSSLKKDQKAAVEAAPSMGATSSKPGQMLVHSVGTPASEDANMKRSASTMDKAQDGIPAQNPLTQAKMDAMDLPPQVIHQIRQLPSHVKKWQDLKLFLAQSDNVPPYVLSELDALQKHQFSMLMAKRQETLKQDPEPQQEQQREQAEHNTQQMAGDGVVDMQLQNNIQLILEDLLQAADKKYGGREFVPEKTVAWMKRTAYGRAHIQAQQAIAQQRVKRQTEQQNQQIEPAITQTSTPDITNQSNMVNERKEESQSVILSTFSSVTTEEVAKMREAHFSLATFSDEQILDLILQGEVIAPSSLGEMQQLDAPRKGNESPAETNRMGPINNKEDVNGANTEAPIEDVEALFQMLLASVTAHYGKEELIPQETIERMWQICRARADEMSESAPVHEKFQYVMPKRRAG
jgi:hypothetical protein